jgi:rubrerythrin
MGGIKYFSGFEVIRAAKEVEKNGHRFYSSMVERTGEPVLKDLFSWLAQDEVEHLRRLSQLEGQYMEGAFEEGEEEFLPYLKQFSDSRIFPAEAEMTAALGTDNADLAALDMAIEAEEKFAEFFARAAELAQSQDGKEAFNWLAGEESRHARVLKERRAQFVAK